MASKKNTFITINPSLSFYIFVTSILLLTLGAFLVYDIPRLAMWFGFCVAGYSAIANDSIQTLGTFLSSNRKLSWYVLWLFVGGILLLTLAAGWYVGHGDIAFGRLQSIPQPTHYTFLELSCPILLVIMTYFRMPVSTTFLLLSVFSNPTVIKNMLFKTLGGYSLAMVCGLVIFLLLAYLFKRFHIKKKDFNQRLWLVLQFLSTAYLWVAWIMHDMANIAVFLPRQLSFNQLILILIYLAIVVGCLMYFRGGRIQKIVTNKSSVKDTRSATIIDFILACLLIFFKHYSHTPMSTTWVFLGLLAGREIAYSAMGTSHRSSKKVAKLVLNDIARAGVGLVISLLFYLATL